MINLVIGPMFAGKTTELVRLLDRAFRAKKRCLVIRNICDERNSEEYVDTHSGIKYSKCKVIKTDKLTSVDVSCYDLIAVDEIQFFQDIDDVIMFIKLVNNREIIMTGLAGDYRQKPFSTISAIIPYCDEITKLKANCDVCGKDANYNKIVEMLNMSTNSDLDSSAGIIKVGGKTTFIPVCFECLY